MHGNRAKSERENGGRDGHGKKSKEEAAHSGARLYLQDGDT